MRASLEERFWQKVNKLGDNDCWEWTAALNGGYGWFLVKGKPRNAHRVSAFLSGLIESVDGGLHVLHKCDNRKCCNPNHFFLGTNIENVADRVSKNRTGFKRMIGQTNGMSKLTDGEIKKVRELYAEGKLSQSKLANMFNIRQPHVSRIVNGARCGGVL